MTQFDDDGVAIPGTFPLSTVRIGMWGGPDGGPVPTATSAVCDVCGGWASTLWVAGTTKTVNDSLTDVRVSRSTEVIVYVCPEHLEQVADSLVDEYGSASNHYEPDDLALAVDRRQR